MYRNGKITWSLFFCSLTGLSQSVLSRSEGQRFDIENGIKSALGLGLSFFLYFCFASGMDILCLLEVSLVHFRSWPRRTCFSVRGT